MTPLAGLLRRRIEASGPITIADYMSDCLLHPLHGYYSTRDPLGRQGDFTTAPEISQMFGELIGLWLAQCWLDQGRPPAISLAELGPGRGTLMADIMRATRVVPGFHAALQIHLVEVSNPLRARQRAALAPNPVTWHEAIDTLPLAPLFLVANEFFDALPIRQFQRVVNGWRERVIGLQDGLLCIGLADPSQPPGLAHRRADTGPGDCVEIRSGAVPIMEAIADRIADHGGAALIIDYGSWQSLGDTLQALLHHAPDPVLAHPGEADLTAHVDFGALARAAGRVAHGPLTPQGVLLERLGITARAQSLGRALTGEALSSHVAAHRRLTHPLEMGQLFQALPLFPKGQPVPPGFEA